MFTQKLSAQPVQKKTSVTSDVNGSSTGNPFVDSGMKTSAKTLSGNGALKFSTTGNPFVDQFGKLGSYKKPRTFADIEKDCETLWARNPLLTVTFILYIRMITRIVTLFNGVSTSISQRGAELRHEGIMRMIWLHVKQESTFWKNIGLFISVGSWKDIITMLQYDLIYNGWDKRVLNWEEMGHLILTGLSNRQTSELLKKYLPQIKANSNCRTIEAQSDNAIAKWICSLLFGKKETPTSYKQYRKLKTSGTAHEWQQLISKRKFQEIDFAKIHGRALFKLVKGKFLKNQGLLDKYTAWITKPETTAKFTGFVHELFQGLGANGSGNSLGRKYPTLASMPKHEQETINKQFATLVEKGGQAEQTSLIVVRDTSGSMASEATGSGMTCYAVAKALALYFSCFLKGKFQNAWIEFNDEAKMWKWEGNTPLEKWFNDHSGFVGSTNFQSVIDLLIEIKATGVSEVDFPTGILCISDGEFNPGQLSVTNVEEAKLRLLRAGFSAEYANNFVIVLWNLQSNHYGKGTGEKFESYGGVPNVFYLSGYSAATVSFLTSKIKNAEELMMEAMNQEILQMVEL